MAELLRNAWMGWFRVTAEGKIMGLFLAALLFLWIGYKQEKQRALLDYSILLAICCIFPMTAAALMLYQTRFYDYEWIWSMVPMTLMTAYAGTKVLAEHWQGFRREAWLKGLPVTAGLLAAAFLCSGLSDGGVDREQERAWQEQTRSILKAVGAGVENGRENPETGNAVCLWAPKKMMGYARCLDSSVLLPYGRNMWEEALGAYSYDTYPHEMEEMYLWMSLVEETCMDDDFDTTDIVLEKMEEQKLSTKACLDTAKQAGVNILVLPETTNRLLFNEVINLIGAQPEERAGCYIFRL